MSKKVIGALLALIMVLSVFSLSALAIGQYDWESTEDATKFKQTWGLADGGNGVVQVTLSTNYGVGPISFVIEGVTLDTVTLGNGYYAGSTIEYNKSTGLVFLYPATGAALKAQSLNNAVVATFTYTGNATPAIKNNPKQNTATGMNGTLIAARCSGEYVNSSDFYVGQTCEILAFGQAPKPEEPTEGADLALKSGVTGVVIDTHKTFGGAYAGAVYGIPFKADGTVLKEADYENYLTATNGGSLVYVKTPYVTRPASYGTGTTVQVKNSDGTVAKTYVIVIFGDVDGSGALAARDIQLGVSEVMNPTLTEVQKLAANCYGLPRGSQTNIIDSYYTIDAGDLKAMCTQVMSGNGYDFVALAEKHALYNTYYQ